MQEHWQLNPKIVTLDLKSVSALVCISIQTARNVNLLMDLGPAGNVGISFLICLYPPSIWCCRSGFARTECAVSGYLGQLLRWLKATIFEHGRPILDTKKLIEPVPNC